MQVDRDRAATERAPNGPVRVGGAGASSTSCVRGWSTTRDRSPPGPCGPWSGRSRGRVPGRCGCGWRRAACAARTCTWPRATCPRGARRPCPGHEVVGAVDVLGPGASRFALGDRIGIAWLRGTCGRCRWCRTRAGEPVPGRPVHRLGRRRRLRGVRGRPRGVRLPAARRARRRRGGAAAVCGDRRLPGAAAGRAAAGRPAGDLRVRRVRARRRAGRASPRGRTVHVLTRSAQARELALRAGRGVGRAGRRRAARAAGRRDPVRAGGRAGPGRDAGARPGRHARRRRHPPLRRAGAGLRRRSCSGRSSCAASPPTRGPTARSSSGSPPRWASARRHAAAARRGGPRARGPGRGPDHRRRRPHGLIVRARRGLRLTTARRIGVHRRGEGAERPLSARPERRHCGCRR